MDNGRNDNSEERSKSFAYVISPVGRLKSHIDKWKSVEGSAYIKDVVENCYKLPLKDLPPAVNLTNNKSARNSSSFVTTEIGNVLEKGVVSTVKEKPVVVNPLTVAYNKKGKPRLVYVDHRMVSIEFLAVVFWAYSFWQVIVSLRHGRKYSTGDTRGC